MLSALGPRAGPARGRPRCPEPARATGQSLHGERPPEEVTSHTDHREPPKKRRCSPSWARLISKVFQADPLVCKRCGGPLKVVAYITDSVAIRQILDHLGLSPPGKPPPVVRELVRVPVDDEGREIAASPA